MRVIDHVKGMMLKGRCVDIIPAGTPLSEQQVRRIWQTGRSARTFNAISAPVPYDRLVLQRGDENDEHYVVVPKEPHYHLDAGIYHDAR